MKAIKKCSLALLSATMVSTLLLGSMPQRVEASNNPQYFWLSLYEPNSGVFTPMIVNDDAKTPDEHEHSTIDDEKSNFKINEGAKALGKIIDETSEISVRTGKKGNCYPYTFPGTISSEDKRVGTSEDKTQAAYVAETLTSNMNSAINFVRANCRLPKLSQKQFFDLAGTLVNLTNENGTKTFIVNISSNQKIECEITSSAANVPASELESLNKSNAKGITSKNYVELSVGLKNGTKTSQRFIYSLPKGYKNGQFLYETVSGVDGLNINSELSWAHVVYQAQYNVIKNVTVDTYTSEGDANWFDQLIANIISGILNFLKSMLGLAGIDDLMLNKGLRDANYYKGIMPYSWFGGISVIYSLALVAALIVTGYSIVKLMIQKNLSTMNVSQKIGLMDGIKDLALTALMLLLFYPFFLLLCQFNYLIVKVLASTVSSLPGFQDSMVTGGVVLGAVILACITFFITLKINITYLVRGITIGMLFALAPYFISTFSIPGKKEQFFSWLRELLANIFIQTFDAIICVIFIYILQTGAFSYLEKLAMAFSFIPLNSFFKNSVFNLGSKSEDVGNQASGILSSAIGNAAAGVMLGLGNKLSHVGLNKGTSAEDVGIGSDGSEGGEGKVSQSNKGEKTIQRIEGNRMPSDKAESGGSFQNKATEFKKGLEAKYDSVFAKGGKATQVIGSALKNTAKGSMHAIPKVAKLAAMTGIQMGTAAAGGHSFAAEMGQTRAARELQDAVWDDGIGRTIGDARDIYNMNDYGTTTNDMEKAAVFGVHGGVFNATDGRGNAVELSGMQMDVGKAQFSHAEQSNLVNALNKSGYADDTAYTFESQGEVDELDENGNPIMVPCFDSKTGKQVYEPVFQNGMPVTEQVKGKDGSPIIDKATGAPKVQQKMQPKYVSKKTTGTVETTLTGRAAADYLKTNRNVNLKSVAIGGEYEGVATQYKSIKNSSGKNENGIWIVHDKKGKSMDIPNIGKMAGR